MCSYVNICVCAGSAREGGLVWRGCAADCDTEDGAAGALADGNANPGDKVQVVTYSFND